MTGHAAWLLMLICLLPFAVSGDKKSSTSSLLLLLPATATGCQERILQTVSCRPSLLIGAYKQRIPLRFGLSPVLIQRLSQLLLNLCHYLISQNRTSEVRSRTMLDAWALCKLACSVQLQFFLASALMPRLLPCDHIISPTPGQPLTDNRGRCASLRAGSQPVTTLCEAI